MNDLENEIRRRYFDSIDDQGWDDEDPRMDFGLAALPYFVTAFDLEVNPARRWRLIRVIWQFRDPQALPSLSIALRDSSIQVWKEALDGFVAIGGSSSARILREAQVELAPCAGATERIEWIAEAIEQIETSTKHND